MLPRFFASNLDGTQTHALLPREESHHLQRVLRLQIGDEVVVFDGRGTAFRARVASFGREGVSVALLEAIAEPPPPVRLTLVQSILKGASMDEVIRDCTMVGVASIQPVIAERTTVKVSVLPKSAERWRRLSLASAKQCGRARLPAIREPLTFVEWAGLRRAEPAFILLEPAAALPGGSTIRELFLQPRPAAATLVVGPEGGWTAAERDLALSAGCSPLSLGPLTLRAEAVPLVASAALLSIWAQ